MKTVLPADYNYLYYLDVLKKRTLLRPKEVEAVYGVSAGSLSNMRRMGTGPEFYKASVQRIYYSHEAIMTWLKTRAVNTNGEQETVQAHGSSSEGYRKKKQKKDSANNFTSSP